MAEWFCANKMALNIFKTTYIIFYNKGKKFTYRDWESSSMKILTPQNNDPGKIHILDHVHNLHSNPNGTV
jgi:hypothetical protein